MLPHQRFAAWVKETGVAQVAGQLGCSPSFVSHVRVGRKRPGLRCAVLIEEATRTWAGGVIHTSEWASAYPLTEEAAEAAVEPEPAKAVGA